MNWFKKLFSLKMESKDVPPMPSWESIVEMLYGKQLDAITDEIVKVIYSKDKSKRYIVLKDEKGLYSYRLEAIYPFDEDEWKYIYRDDNACPAMWERFLGVSGKSVFSNAEELMKELTAEPEYKQYFM